MGVPGSLLPRATCRLLVLESDRIVSSHRVTSGPRNGGRSCCSGSDPVGTTLIADDCGEIAISEIQGSHIGAPDRDELCVIAIIDKTRPHGPIGLSESAPIVDDDGGGVGRILVELLPARGQSG